MKLTEDAIKQINGLLEPGMVLEVHVGEDLKLRVHRRPSGKDDIMLPAPIQTSDTDETELGLVLRKIGDTPVVLGSVSLPVNYFIAGIKGYQGDPVSTEDISQEMRGDAGSGD